jgi:hypothetical protein
MEQPQQLVGTHQQKEIRQLSVMRYFGLIPIGQADLLLLQQLLVLQSQVSQQVRKFK